MFLFVTCFQSSGAVALFVVSALFLRCWAIPFLSCYPAYMFLFENVKSPLTKTTLDKLVLCDSAALG